MPKLPQVILLSLAFLIASFMTHSTAYTQEQQLPEKLAQEIARFWQGGLFSSFQTKDNVRINYAAFITDPDAQCLVISPGRVEGYLKYQELIYDLSQHNINIFIIDHRGQGLSQRLLNNPHKGHVEQFDDYTDDLYQFINQIVTISCSKKSRPLLLAHSMGSAIAIRTMQKYPDTIKSALLSSPMIAINSGGLPLWLAKIVIGTGNFFNSLFNQQAWYFFGQGDYQARQFSDNQLMHSKIRYQTFIELYQKHPQLQLGGVTFNWLQQAIKVNQAIFTDLKQLNTPITILQASADTIVDNQAQNKFCQQLQQIDTQLCQQPKVIENAYHELFFEKDSYRNQVMTEVSNWLAQNK
ncbi:lysophospholipase L2 [Thalassotalea insulae]|uniref:Lysophospholipase L2 n=1 Tax=Thalassotalea insulae TaxID=2056778 RepID=A0ABQ6GQB7_9GAMM|nr:alpha/beta fold hydrolase [Thalassotalea insulae]GLX78168.1 lysophospholipase L2 [Thalassotalea insulae]